MTYNPMTYNPMTSKSMTLMGLLIALRAARVRLEVDSAGLRVIAPAGVLTPSLREAITRHKAALETLPHPYINEAAELIQPSLAPPQYHWQTRADTLRDLQARKTCQSNAKTT